MGFIDRLWKRVSGGEAAERAELAGNLVDAIQLWMSSGDVDEAARVMVLRGDAEPDPKMRLQHYTQAAATATVGSPEHTVARVKKARLTVSLAEGGSLSTALRRDVIEAAAELVDAGEAAAAAEAYALAGDTEGEARALTQAGDIDRLEALLSNDQSRATLARRTKEAHVEVDALILAGQRRDALALAEASPDDPQARARVARLRGARILGPIVHITLRGQRMVLVLAREVVIGRTEGAITVASSSLSRKHVAIGRTDGRFVVKDLGSRNGTQLRGLNVGHALEVGDGVTITLGGEVPVTLAPCAELPDALMIEVGGTRYVALLRDAGDAPLGVASWRLASATDGWVELVSDGGTSPFAADMALVARVTLLRGDAFACERSGEVVLRIEE